MCDIFDSYVGFDQISTYFPEDGNQYIEGFGDETGKIARFETGTLRHEEIKQWLQTRRQGVRLRIFIGKPKERSRPVKRVHPFSLEVLHDIISHFGIPEAFANIIASHTTVTYELDCNEANGTNHLPGILSALAAHAFAITLDTENDITYGLFLRCCHHQASTFTRVLQERASELSTPMSIAVAWLNLLGQTRARRVIGRRDGLARSEIDIGIHWSRDDQTMKKQLKDLDFREMTRRLTVFGSESSWDVHAIDAQLQLAGMCRRVQRSLNLLSSAKGSEGAQRAFQSRLRHAEQMLEGLRLCVIDNQQRAQVQLQTIFSLVSQRDSEISYATAKASQSIAEASQRDGALMKQIAEDSKQVSLRTWRDGVDMRIMAAVTLLTLPGTFTAVCLSQILSQDLATLTSAKTLFSTSFFDFQPPGATTVVSHWVWLYCVVTAGLTLAFIVAWYCISRAMMRDEPIGKAGSSSSTTTASARPDSPTNFPKSAVLHYSHGRGVTAASRLSPDVAYASDQEGIAFHNLSDAMAPEEFGRACAMCGVPLSS